jgi:hypothetical protein
MAIYGSDLLTNRFSQQLFSGQGTYTADGWTGLGLGSRARRRNANH